MSFQLQDVSRLLDLCRQSIYFESLSGVADCLAALARVRDVEVVRVKNRLDPEAESAATAGYRNLAINLRLATPEARALGVETHVCEIQLLLVSMAAIKVPLTSAVFEACSHCNGVCCSGVWHTPCRRSLSVLCTPCKSKPKITVWQCMCLSESVCAAVRKQELWFAPLSLTRVWQNDEGHKKYILFRNLRGE